MTDIVDTAPAQVDTAPNVDNTPTEVQTTPETPTTPAATPAATPDFALPDEYKEKSWAGKVKSQEDAYKQIDSMSELIGKKTIQPIDYATATPDEIAAHHGSLAPEDVKAYGFSDENPDLSKTIGDNFQKLGINEHQSNGLMAMIAEMDANKEAVNRDDDTYLDMLKDSFGENYKETAKAVDADIVKYSSEADAEFFNSISDNKTRAALDRTVHAMKTEYEARIQKVLTDHGVTETSAQSNGGEASLQTVDVDSQIKGYKDQVRALTDKPHTHADKQVILDKIDGLYQQKVKTMK